MRRKPESKAVARAREELAGIVVDLRVVKARVLNVERRLRRAARTGDVVGTRHDNGGAPRPYTVEEYFAGCIHGDVFEVGGNLSDTIKNFIDDARANHRVRARECLNDLDGTPT